MTSRPNPKKDANRPRLDAVIRAIRDGKYDSELGQIKGAIEDRNKVRQEAALEMVKEVYGEEFTVIPNAKSNPNAGYQPQQPWQGGGTIPQPNVDELEPGVDPELGFVSANPGARASEPAFEGSAPQGAPEITSEGGGESTFESRSPLIGPVNPA
jgi:hypothetical protein